MNSHRLMIVAGEASGDAHAAALVQALRALEPETRFDFFGATGPLLRTAGVESIVNSDDLSIQRDVDLLISILPFEQDWYADRGIGHVEYVGHPLAGEVRARFDRAEFC